MNKKEKQRKQRELERLLEACLKELPEELNLRLLADMDAAACLDEPLLWVERIVPTGVTYPVPRQKSFPRRMIKKLADALAVLRKRIKFW